MAKTTAAKTTKAAPQKDSGKGKIDARESQPSGNPGSPTAPGERRQFVERRKVQRRRQIDPTTCERDYSTDEIEFMRAMDEYKRNNGRMFPTCSEILEVVRGLGYIRPQSVDDAEPTATGED